MYNKLVNHLEEDFNSEKKNVTVRKNGLNESTVNEDWASPELIKLGDDLMPNSGAAETIEGELVRALSKIMYRYYNDGDKFYKGYGAETAGPAAIYLITKSSELGIQGVREAFESAERGLEDEGYEQFLNTLDGLIVEYIADKQGQYTPNDDDMLSDTYRRGAEGKWQSTEDDEDDMDDDWYDEDGEDQSDEDESVKEDQGEIIGIPDDTDAPVREEEAKGVNAEELHNWYLEGSKELDPENFNEEAQVPYESLPEPQKKIDQFIADKINQKLGNV